MSTALSAPQHHIIVPPPEQAPGVDWKQQLAERLESYRAKHSETSEPPSIALSHSANSRASRIARAVASRYAAVPTHRELMLAAEQAQQVFLAEQAAKAAEAAEQARQAAALEDSTHSLESSNSAENPSPSPSPAEQSFQQRYGSAIKTQPATPVMPQFAVRSREMHLHQAAQEPEPSLEDLLASALVEPRASLPSKLIEFPRELVSAHRARPRLPESSRSAENAAEAQIPTLGEPDPPQLRIFEVQPEIESAEIETPRVETGHSQSNTVTQPNLFRTPAEVAENAAPQPDIAAKAEAGARNSTPVAAKNITQPGSPINSLSTNSSINRSSYSTPGVAPRPSIKIDSSDRPSSAGRPAGSPSQRDTNSSPVRAFKGLEWAAISLDKEPAAYRHKLETSVADYVPFMVEPASIDRRVMAFAVDFAAVSAGFLAFLAVFAASTPHLPTGLIAVALGSAVYVALWVLYQMLFFSLSGATAGMLYARIALCTFDDQNPTRSALRRRLAVWWLSCLPLGLGFLWCFVDEDNLSWHDRMTRMYQRAY